MTSQIDGLCIEDDDGIVRVAGELDVANAALLDDRLGREDCPLLLDLRGVDFMDAAAMDVLLRHRERCTARGQEFQLVAWSPAVERVLVLSGMQAIFTSTSTK